MKNSNQICPNNEKIVTPSQLISRVRDWKGVLILMNMMTQLEESGSGVRGEQWAGRHWTHRHSAEDLILCQSGDVSPCPAADCWPWALSLPPSPCPRTDLMMGIRPLEKLRRSGGPPTYYTPIHTYTYTSVYCTAPFCVPTIWPSKWNGKSDWSRLLIWTVRLFTCF